MSEADIMMPAFARHQKEAAIIGRLLAGYGELELQLAQCIEPHVRDLDTAVRALFCVRSASSRIEIADVMIRTPLAELGLGPEYEQALEAIRTCLKIRNRLAHCHWTETPEGHLAAINLDRATKGNDSIDWNAATRIDPDSLKGQEQYFCYARDCLRYLHSESARRVHNLRPHRFRMPPKIPPPLVRSHQAPAH